MSTPPGPVMREFALIFRPGGPLDPGALPKRNAAARDWALALRRQGKLKAASPLEDEGVIVSDRGVQPVEAGEAVASVLVVEAQDLEAAVDLAKKHPGLAFGTEIEVRPVKVVAPAP